jgi:hypothetical protein
MSLSTHGQSGVDSIGSCGEGGDWRRWPLLFRELSGMGVKFVSVQSVQELEFVDTVFSENLLAESCVTLFVDSQHLNTC